MRLVARDVCWGRLGLHDFRNEIILLQVSFHSLSYLSVVHEVISPIYRLCLSLLVDIRPGDAGAEDSITFHLLMPSQAELLVSNFPAEDTFICF